MRRRSTGTAMARCVSVRTSSPSRISPASGASSPEIRLTNVLLPLPERPNSAITPGTGAAKVASSTKPARALRTATCSTSATQIAAHAPYQQFRGQEPGETECERDHREAQRERVARRRLHRRVERQRQRTGDAGNVGGEGDHGTKLPESGGKGGDCSGEDSRQHQRQRDG